MKFRGTSPKTFFLKKAAELPLKFFFKKKELPLKLFFKKAAIQEQRKNPVLRKPHRKRLVTHFCQQNPTKPPHPKLIIFCGWLSHQIFQRNPRVKFIGIAFPFYKCTFFITENHLIDSKYFLCGFL